jgi:hypothetical protein
MGYGVVCTCNITLPYEYISPCVVTAAGEARLSVEIRKQCSGAAQRTDPPIDDVTYNGPQVSVTTLERPKSASNAFPLLSMSTFDFKNNLVSISGKLFDEPNARTPVRSPCTALCE